MPKINGKDFTFDNLGDFIGVPPIYVTNGGLLANKDIIKKRLHRLFFKSKMDNAQYKFTIENGDINIIREYAPKDEGTSINLLNNDTKNLADTIINEIYSWLSASLIDQSVNVAHTIAEVTPIPPANNVVLDTYLYQILPGDAMPANHVGRLPSVPNPSYPKGIRP
jgi:hypothetical protein